jgi:nucleotide-binding universal stress UspA family protein
LEFCMSFDTIMVHLDVGANNENILGLARGLAERFDSRIIGIAASQSMIIPFADGYGSGELIVQNRLEIEKEMADAEVAFRRAFAGFTPPIDWRSAISFQSSAEFIAGEMRAADMLVTGPERGGDFFDTGRRVEIGDLVMRMGRPVMIVPSTISSLKLESVLVGWKDTRETRRAIVDALPLLKKADRVMIASIASGADIAAAEVQVQDTKKWLERHEIKAKGMVAKSTGDDATQLSQLVHEIGADLLVAGGYGHNRLREWMFGGVTRDLLLHPTHCTFLSH